MDIINLVRQSVNFQKIAADNTFELLSSVQNSGRNILEETMDHYSWVPQYLKSECLTWSDSCLLTVAQCKTMLAESYEEALHLLEPSAEKDQPAMKKVEKSHSDAAVSADTVIEQPKLHQSAVSLSPVIALKEINPETSVSPAQESNKPSPPVKEVVAESAPDKAAISAPEAKSNTTASQSEKTTTDLKVEKSESKAVLPVVDPAVSKSEPLSPVKEPAAKTAPNAASAPATKAKGRRKPSPRRSVAAKSNPSTVRRTRKATTASRASKTTPAKAKDDATEKAVDKKP